MSSRGANSIFGLEEMDGRDARETILRMLAKWKWQRKRSKSWPPGKIHPGTTGFLFPQFSSSIFPACSKTSRDHRRMSDNRKKRRKESSTANHKPASSQNNSRFKKNKRDLDEATGYDVFSDEEKRDQKQEIDPDNNNTNGPVIEETPDEKRLRLAKEYLEKLVSQQQSQIDDGESKANNNNNITQDPFFEGGSENEEDLEESRGVYGSEEAKRIERAISEQLKQDSVSTSLYKRKLVYRIYMYIYMYMWLCLLDVL